MNMRRLKREEVELFWTIDRSEVHHYVYEVHEGQLVRVPKYYEITGWRADAVEKDISWTAFPRLVQINSVNDVQRWRKADGSREVQDEYREWIEGFRSGKSIAGVERGRQKKDGTLIDVAIWTAPLRDAGGRITCRSG